MSQTRAKDVQGVPKNGGQYATPLHAEPTQTLQAEVADENEFPPIMVSVTLEKWEDDYAVAIGSVEFDATKILYTYDDNGLSELDDHSHDGDNIFYEAVRQGLVPDHDGPFEVHVREAIDAAQEAHPDRFSYNHRPIELAAGEQEDFDELADGDVMEQIAVSRSVDGETVTVEATKSLNLVDLAPGNLNYSEKLEWLSFNGPSTASFFRERYSADLSDSDEGFELMYATTSKDVPFEGLTPAKIAAVAWDSGIVAIHNEYDNGTYGTENMDRLLQEVCTEPPVFPTPTDSEVFIRSDHSGTERLSAQKLMSPTTVPGFSRAYNRYTGEFAVTTPDGDRWVYSKAA